MGGGKYRNYVSDKPNIQKDLQRVHPIWRGVGFAMMVLIPIISYAAMQVLLQQNARHGWFPLPADLFATPGQFLYNLIPDPLLYIKIVLFLLCAFLLYFVFLLVSALITGAAGVNPKNDPFYVPPVRRTKVDVSRERKMRRW